jgi:hypothetical protein
MPLQKYHTFGKVKKLIMTEKHIDILATSLSLRDTQVRNTIKLLVEGATFLFIIISIFQKVGCPLQALF